MKHTKEPWHVMEEGFGTKGNNNPTVYATDTELRYICKCADGLNIEPTDNVANARRIALCVNKCAGITDEALDADVIKRMFEFEHGMHEEWHETETAIKDRTWGKMKIWEDDYEG